MRIVSMVTYSYRNWIHTFYNSIRRENPETQITIYLVNFPEEKAHLVRSYFPDVEFIEHNGSFALKESHNVGNKSYKVTYLKGQFMRRTLEFYREPCLWIDITALIRTNLSDVEEKLNTHEAVVIQRDPKVKTGLKAFAAEIFGFSDKNKFLYKDYELYCNSNKSLWYADQIGLSKLKTNKKGFLPFGPFCNFHYEKDARTWSDRGRTGKGTLTQDDEDYTIKKFLDDLTKDNKAYKMQYSKYLKSFDKVNPKILVFLDDEKWCYKTSAMEVVKRLGRYYDFQVATTVEKDRDKIKRWKGDFIWARCGLYRAVKVLALKPDYKNKIITSVTTGGWNAEHVIKRHKDIGIKTLGIFTQNQFTVDMLEKHGLKEPVYFIPNGVDIDKFSPGEDLDQDFTIGFAGRHADKHGDNTKGYSEFVLPTIDALKCRKLISDSKQNYIPHEKMPQFYNNIHVLLQPSTHEGCSNTVMEAMAAGVPCIITKTGYHGEVCEDGKNVLFVDRDRDSILKAMKKIQKPKVYTKISEGGREFAKKHSWDIIAKKYKKVFDKIYKNL